MIQLDEIHQLLADDRAAVDDLITHRLQSDVVLINQLGRYIIKSGGKRLRPLLLLLAARACGYQGTQHQLLAAIIEFIHTATLLHDDVVDASELRRGQETANAVWGNEASVLVGDFLYSRAFEMMVEVGDMRIMDILSHATNTIAEGEVMQLLNVHNPETSEEQYLKVILSKTAKLFEAGSQLGAVIAGQNAEIEQALQSYGLHIGTAFQLTDDVLDYSASADEMGKNVGDDLAEGKPTLPLIYAMHKGSEEERKTVSLAIQEGGLKHIDAVLAAIHNTGAIDYTQKMAEHETSLARNCLNALPASPYKDAMLALTELAINRRH